MSETKTMTKERILEIFRSEYNSVLRKYERKVEKYALKMNEDYEHFFRWNGGDMYKAQANLTAVREFRPITSLENLDEIRGCLERHIGNIERTLVDGRQYPTGTSIMHNVAETLGRVAQQELRADLQRLLMIITYNG